MKTRKQVIYCAVMYTDDGPQFLYHAKTYRKLDAIIKKEMANEMKEYAHVWNREDFSFQI